MTACSVEGVKARLSSISKKPVKSLGQNFLIDENARNEIVAHSSLEGKPVLEIGPGLGALTQGLLDAGAGKIAAVEKDAVLSGLLKAEYADEARLSVINGDILKVEMGEIENMLGRDYFVAGSLPYYITSPIILRMLEHAKSISGMTLIIQQEASERFFAAPGDEVYGPLTAASSLTYAPRRGVCLSPASFYPQPNVHSIALHLERKTDYSSTERIKGFITFLKTAFAMRRKTLMNNLMSAGHKREAIEVALHQINASRNIRAEAIDPKALFAIYESLREYQGQY